ncbi:MAG: FHA domain-containing protein [Candidatus Eisenbacteria bacterium]
MEDRVRGRDIIAQVVANLRSQGEELRYSTIVPAAYDVYLHPTDYQRLESLAGVIADQARRALDEELDKINRASQIEARVREALRRPRLPRERAGSAWEIRLISDPNDELAPGDILVDSTLVLPESESLSGSRTRRIVTTRRGDRVESHEAPANEPAPAPAARVSPPRVEPSAPATMEPAPGALATLTYRDENGDHLFRMEKPQVVVGRGGPGYWVDLQLKTVPDVSRDHLRLRYEEPERRFYIKDLSTLGTTVNGTAIPSSIELRDGERVDRNVEVPLPPEAEIGLAGAVFIRFRAEVQA